jgi:hypothetical protein
LELKCFVVVVVLTMFPFSLPAALLLSEFRFGWDMSIQAIASESSEKSAFQTFMVVMVKGKMGVAQTIKSSLDQSAEYCNMRQVLYSSGKLYE